MGRPKKSQLTRAKATKYGKGKRITAPTHSVRGGSLNDSPEVEITPSQPPKKKGRGAGEIRPVKEDIADRPVIWRVGPHEFSCAKSANKITATITRLALKYMPAPFRSFHSFDKTIKDKVERDFLERYTYHEDEDVDCCRAVLDAIAAKRYCEELGTARRNRIKKYRWDIVSWKTDVPHWSVVPEFWRGLCDIWFTEEWQMVSKRNQLNRTSSGGTISHYAGSASAHQHFEKLTKLFNGRKPTMEDLYIHMHCARENGVSPVVAQISTAKEGVAEDNENSDGNREVDPSCQESTMEFDINTLQFTNTEKENIYMKVKAMKADQANAELDESALFLTALGGPKHGRVIGFGSVIAPIKTANNRDRQNNTSSVSGLTNCGQQEIFTRSEMNAMMEDRDRHIAEERAQMKRDQAQNLLMFAQLYKTIGIQQLPSQDDLTSQPSQEVPSHLEMEFNQDAAGSIQPNQGPFQALLSSRNVQEIAGHDAAMSDWLANQPST
ncbi:Plant transposase (Ptta/En/Spm family) [Carex littledalei]|uniref:Plant transposase (Ptta/En/Spm family) n=1 Tax=Carex littledalei TaxID=544730 RepID=A0A833V8Q1_9POAL|nr:Plant transposase (Ptta/En/Spm family) [Carex littledalei]